MTNEELFYLLQKFYPGTINGTHYLTGHRLDLEGAQFGDAFITGWKLPDAEPTPKELRALWAKHAREIKSTVAAAHVRQERNERLLLADAMVYKAEDSGDTQAIAKARKYRQALRDVPQQAGFPLKCEWPEPPQ